MAAQGKAPAARSRAVNAEVLRKQVDVVHSSAPMTLKERHCANALLLNAMRNGIDSLQDRRKHFIGVADLNDAVFGDRQRNQANIRRALDGLVEKRVEWQYTIEKSRRSIGSSTWLAGYNIEDGVLQYSYSAEIIDKILQPRVYARLNYSIQHRIKRSHTQTLYENCARYRDNGRTKTWSLEVFRGLMGILDRTTYKEFKLLNRDVIKPAVQEINEKTEIYIVPHFGNKQGKTAEVYFEISDNLSYKGPMIPNVIPISRHFDSEMLEERAEVYEKLLTFGLGHTSAVDVLERYDDAYICDNLKVVSRRLRDGKNIRNLGGYAVTALEKDYREQPGGEALQNALDLETPEDREERKRIERVEEARQALQEFETDTLPAWRAQRWADNLDDTDYELARDAFKEHAVAENSFVRKVIGNPDSAWCTALWRQWIRDHKLEAASEDEYQKCAADVGFDLKRHRAAVQEKPED